MPLLLTLFHARGTSERAPGNEPTYLHDAVPVVSGRHPEEGEEGHAEVGEGGVAAQALAGIVFAAICAQQGKAPP